MPYAWIYVLRVARSRSLSMCNGSIGKALQWHPFRLGLMSLGCMYPKFSAVRRYVGRFQTNTQSAILYCHLRQARTHNSSLLSPLDLCHAHRVHHMKQATDVYLHILLVVHLLLEFRLSLENTVYFSHHRQHDRIIFFFWLSIGNKVVRVCGINEEKLYAAV